MSEWPLIKQAALWLSWILSVNHRSYGILRFFNILYQVAPDKIQERRAWRDIFCVCPLKTSVGWGTSSLKWIRKCLSISNTDREAIKEYDDDCWVSLTIGSGIQSSGHTGVEADTRKAPRTEARNGRGYYTTRCRNHYLVFMNFLMSSWLPTKRKEIRSVNSKRMRSFIPARISQ